MPKKNTVTSWKEFERLASKNQKFMRDLMRNPANPNTVLQKYGQPPMRRESVARWKKTWNKVISLVIEPGLAIPRSWGKPWVEHWKYPDFRITYTTKRFHL